jgi:hypothetical protein
MYYKYYMNCKLCKDGKNYSKDSLAFHMVGFHKKHKPLTKAAKKVIEQIENGTWKGFEHEMVS